MSLLPVLTLQAIEDLSTKGNYSGSAHDLQLFLDEFVRLKPEPVALTLLKTRAAQMHPSQVHEAFYHQATFITDLQLFLEFYYRRETRARVRLEALRALEGASLLLVTLSPSKAA